MIYFAFTPNLCHGNHSAALPQEVQGRGPHDQSRHAPHLTVRRADLHLRPQEGRIVQGRHLGLQARHPQGQPEEARPAHERVNFIIMHGLF